MRLRNLLWPRCLRIVVTAFGYTMGKTPRPHRTLEDCGNGNIKPYGRPGVAEERAISCSFRTVTAEWTDVRRYKRIDCFICEVFSTVTMSLFVAASCERVSLILFRRIPNADNSSCLPAAVASASLQRSDLAGVRSGRSGREECNCGDRDDSGGTRTVAWAAVQRLADYMEALTGVGRGSVRLSTRPDRRSSSATRPWPPSMILQLRTKPRRKFRNLSAAARRVNGSPSQRTDGQGDQTGDLRHTETYCPVRRRQTCAPSILNSFVSVYQAQGFAHRRVHAAGVRPQDGPAAAQGCASHD